jgi:hypothetical protein
MKRAVRLETAVEEIQGLYGPFTFSEKLLQQIWARGEFDQTNLCTNDGRGLQVLQAGRWNLLGGPDFKDAKLKFEDGAVVAGDVELHLRANDWAVHRHANDPAYDHVLLHVVLFPDERGQTTVGAQGREIPTLVLLPRLHHDLEEYAAEAAIERLAGLPLPRMLEELRLLAPEALTAELRSRADARWRQKVHFARLRVSKLGWSQACHHAALEILGYRFNRAPMLRLAAGHPLVEWSRGGVDADRALAREEGRWSLQGVRPANHPRARLRQYAAWVNAVPDWPAHLLAMAAELPGITPVGGTREVRRRHHLSALRTGLARRICALNLGGTRLDNMVCDGWLPLLTAQTGKDLSGLWHHWYPGDQPPVLLQALRRLGVFSGPAHPACHGTVQGLQGRLLAQDLHRG